MLVTLCDLVFQFDAGIQVSENVKMDVNAVETGRQVSRTRNVWEAMLTIPVLINYYAGAASAAGNVRTFFLFFLSFFFFLFFRISGEILYGICVTGNPRMELVLSWLAPSAVVVTF